MMIINKNIRLFHFKMFQLLNNLANVLLVIYSKIITTICVSNTHLQAIFKLLINTVITSSHNTSPIE